MLPSFNLMLPHKKADRMPPTALLYNPSTKNWLKFDTPLKTFTTSSLSDVPKLLRTVEIEVERHALHAVGFVSYEASPAFEPAGETVKPGDFPLLWFGLFSPPEQTTPPLSEQPPLTLDWQPALDETGFCLAVETIKTAIANGETYQVNFTFPLTASIKSDPWPLFCRLVQNQPDGYGAWIDTGRYVIASASPELFFERCAGRVSSKPMKGTTTRGLNLTTDHARAETLQLSVKERAENIMVLDMIRNDLAQLAGGPVQVDELCSIEKHPTVWQMTSMASTATEASTAEIFTKLFPCASITGAPKLRTMHHIAALETVPRGLYTGAIGHIEPGRQARFSVAIRTALIDRETKTASYGIGAGITWDSDPVAEYRECLAKAQILHQTRSVFSLLESLLWEPESGYFLLDQHLARLKSSADYFNYSFHRTETLNALQSIVATLSLFPHKIRLLLNQSGELSTEASKITPHDKNKSVRIRVAGTPVDLNDLFLYHKTTVRSLYDAARQATSDCDDVLLYNKNGEVTESCNANLVVRHHGRLITPPVECGLLAGTMRADLLAKKVIVEQIIKLEDLADCTELYLINSVRRWRRATLVTD
jgi:para-aminobenzoate synthetase/4-amino-4-deoxychorismate lyase